MSEGPSLLAEEALKLIEQFITTKDLPRDSVSDPGQILPGKATPLVDIEREGLRVIN